MRNALDEARSHYSREVKSEGALICLQAMNYRSRRFFASLHAGTAQKAILRLVLMARFGMDLPAEIIEKQIATSLDLIVMSQRFPDGKTICDQRFRNLLVFVRIN